MSYDSWDIAAHILRLINEGHLASRVEAYREEFRATDLGYAKAREKSRAQAEAWLAEEVNFTVGASLEPIALSIAKLAQSSSGDVVDITKYDSKLVSQIECSTNYRMRRTFVAFGSSWFDALPLHAVILRTGYDGCNTHVEVTLVCSVWSSLYHSRRESYLAFITLTPTGQVTSELYRPYMETEGGRETPLTCTPRSLLRYLLGMDAPGEILASSAHNAGLDGVFGFPGAKRYFLEVLPRLHETIR